MRNVGRKLVIAEYKITIGPRPFSNQNTGLTDQTCNHLAICADQFFE